MAEDPQYAARLDNKRKFDDPSAAPPARRASGFSSGPVAAPSTSPPDAKGSAAAIPSYNNVPPPPDDIQLAKMRAQEIAARIFSAAESKRPRVEADGGESGGHGDISHKSLGHSMTSTQIGGMAPTSSYQSYGGYQGANKKIDIPNDRVGVIIGKGGETIKYLQIQSGAKIQVTRDMDADPGSQTRIVELTGTSEQISKAEQLINDVLSEAESGASGIVAARKFPGAQVGSEHFVMLVPNNKVGLVIGKGGETIKNMQAKSGARIQLIPLHLPPGDTSTERTVHIDGTPEQIESAKQLVNEVISENRVRNTQSGGYSQQGYRPPRPQTNWGPPAPAPMQQTGYGYMQPGAYPGPPPQYTQPPYSGYPPQSTSASYSSGWDQSTNTQNQPGPPGSGYDYYNQQGQAQPPAMSGSSAPTDSTNYNYAQTQGAYSEATYAQQPVGQQQGYSQDGYGGYQVPTQQQGYGNPPTNAQPGYEQQNYGTAPQYSTMTTSTQDGSTPAYASQGASSQVPPAQQAQPVQPAAQQGYPHQSSTTPPAYPSQSGQTGYGVPPTTQPSYANHLPSPVGYSQPSPHSQSAAYGQSPVAQKPPAQGGYNQPLQPGYGTQPPAGQSTYGGAPPSGYATTGGQPGYNQQAYGGPQAPSQSGYGQQTQQYGDPYNAAAYTQPPVYPADGAAGGNGHVAYDAQASSQVVAGGVTKASPKAQN